MTTVQNESAQAEGSILILAPEGHPAHEAMPDSAGGHSVLAATSVQGACDAVSEASVALALVHSSMASPTQLGDLAAVRVLLDEGAGGAQGDCGDYFDFALPMSALADQLPGLLKVGRRLMEAKASLQDLSRSQHGAGREFSGCSAATRRVNTALRRAADSEATILVEGREGTGKSMAAQWIHLGSRRCNRPAVVVDGSELDVDRLPAVLADAAATTLVIEAVESVPAKAQSLLVRHLKERPTHGNGHARIVATTSARLPELVARGQFREDLFYRLNMFPVVMPMLRERREDIAALAKELCQRHASNADVPRAADVAFTPAAMILLESHPWDGNVTQLANVLERAMSLAGDGPIDRMHVLGPSTGLSANFDSPLATRQAPAEDDELREDDIRPLQEEEERLLSRALKATRGNVRRAAQLLGIGRATLYRKIQVYDLKLT